VYVWSCGASTGSLFLEMYHNSYGEYCEKKDKDIPSFSVCCVCLTSCDCATKATSAMEVRWGLPCLTLRPRTRFSLFCRLMMRYLASSRILIRCQDMNGIAHTPSGTLVSGRDCPVGGRYFQEEDNVEPTGTALQSCAGDSDHRLHLSLSSEASMHLYSLS
jgi:hypothetical protein